MNSHRLATAIVMSCLTAGCVHTGATKTTAIEVPARSPSCGLDVVFQGQPPHPYVVLGEVDTNWTAPPLFAVGDSDVATMRRLTDRACAMGAHGLMNIVVARRQGFGRKSWKSTSVTTEAFLYVDESGRPLAPPNRTRIIVPPAAVPEPQPSSVP